ELGNSAIASSSSRCFTQRVLSIYRTILGQDRAPKLAANPFAIQGILLISTSSSQKSYQNPLPIL
ncbi:MAG: hypothetical protein ABI988_13125, partial [Nitrospirota bacterium]